MVARQGACTLTPAQTHAVVDGTADRRRHRADRTCSRDRPVLCGSAIAAVRSRTTGNRDGAPAASAAQHTLAAQADPRPRCGRGQHARRAWLVRGGRAWPAGVASCRRRPSHCCGTGWYAQRHATHDRDASCGHGMAMPPPRGRPFPAARTTLTAARSCGAGDAVAAASGAPAGPGDRSRSTDPSWLASRGPVHAPAHPRAGAGAAPDRRGTAPAAR